MPTDIALSLTADEALVLFEWITQFNKREDVSFVDQAEQRVLWDLESMLEAALAEPFRDDYDTLLAAARARVRDPND
jgi:hypothetical protein